MDADSEWRQAGAEVPRELFVPEVIWVDDDRVGGYVAVSRSDDPRRWWELVAADAAVVTQVDDGRTLPGSLGRSPSRNRLHLVAWRGEPDPSRFGMTVLPDKQVVWLDDPANPVPSSARA